MIYLKNNCEILADVYNSSWVIVACKKNVILLSLKKLSIKKFLLSLFRYARLRTSVKEFQNVTGILRYIRSLFRKIVLLRSVSVRTSKSRVVPRLRGLFSVDISYTCVAEESDERERKSWKITHVRGITVKKQCSFLSLRERTDTRNNNK